MGKKDALLEEALLMITALVSTLASSGQPRTENLKLLQRWRLACSRHIWILSHIYALFWKKILLLPLDKLSLFCCLQAEVVGQGVLLSSLH